MASITDCVVEGLKYPFNDIKKLLGFGVLCALMSALSTFIGIKSVNPISQIPFTQLPAGHIYPVAGLAILSFIVTLFIWGYQYDILKFSIDKKADLPGFSDILGMLIKGIKYFIVTAAYYIIPIIVFVVGTILAGNSSAAAAVTIILVVLLVIAYFLLVMALNNMVAHDDIRKAFDFRQIIDNISNLGWGKYIGIILFTIIVMMIISVAVSFVMGFLSLGFAIAINQVTVVSVVIAIIEGLFIDSYMGLFFNRVCGSVYREAVK
ncbi:DUF4013 domain-containing protein [uncultured Methanobrevibacter sp.]|uniref:DUF4013 domain-containing protein n=1 Tax=uncultured Methanobrevibacter sp. TaxID=253161 RepID=UPI0025F30122|nr:DUF4013 domain-containing protein [uncultured Methanobrevibacter sp.]